MKRMILACVLAAFIASAADAQTQNTSRSGRNKGLRNTMYNGSGRTMNSGSGSYRSGTKARRQGSRNGAHSHGAMNNGDTGTTTNGGR